MSAENRLLRQYVRQKTLVNDTPIGHNFYHARKARLEEIEARLKRRLVKQ